MKLALIVAAAENDVIGREGALPWRLSADLKRFKRLTTGHAVLMGRRTWESIARPLPERRMIVVTRQAGYRAEGIETAGSLEEAIALARDGRETEAFVIGGAEMYRLALPVADRIYLTRVRARVEGDVVLPPIDWSQWRLVAEELHEADERNEHGYTFADYQQIARWQSF
jgi:dihydrofolate reductase